MVFIESTEFDFLFDKLVLTADLGLIVFTSSGIVLNEGLVLL